MCDIPVFYATTEGQTRRIAERIAERIRMHGLDSRAIDVTSQEARTIDWSRLRGAALGASLHLQKHQAVATAFARRHRDVLGAVPSLFFSVSLAAHSSDVDEVASARRIAERFAVDTGWEPSRIACIAGRLAYTEYNFFVRLVMRRIALKEGGSGDTSRDHEYTDWLQVQHLADDLVDAVRRRNDATSDCPPFLRIAS
jgi:menaquinone-dependent protoporphyrinogen oxidase